MHVYGWLLMVINGYGWWYKHVIIQYKYVWCHNHGIMWLNTTNNMLCTIECQLVQCPCADESSPELCYYGVDHTPHCRLFKHTMATFSLRSNVDSTTRPWQRADFTSHFARGSVACRAGLSKRAALVPLARARECISMAPRPWQPRLYTRQSWIFWTCRRAHLLCPPG